MNGRSTHPIASHLDRIRLAIFVLAKRFVPCATTDAIPVFQDHEVVDRGVGQGLRSGDTRHTTTSALVSTLHIK